MIAKQIDNFFEYPNIILNEAKKIKLYTRKEHPDYLKSEGATWPGLRSLELGKSNPLLKYFCAKYLHLNNINFNEKSVLYVHCRPSNKNEKDFIHDDNDGQTKHSILIYISKTNFESGTRLYDEKEQVITDFKFIQNRLVFFDSSYKHMAYGHHGDNINNSRITINGFLG